MDKFDKLKTYNKISKEMDIIYHDYAKRCGLSDMSFWILYSIVESDTYFTQREFCNDWFCAPQTVNSALKDLEKKDIIFLENVIGNKKNKLIKPTKKGKDLIERIIYPLIREESNSLDILTKNECEIMLFAMKKYMTALKVNVNSLNKDDY